jgi:L-alanine-DL-glutamate epimerase-like enolase superfamily enzyme
LADNPRLKITDVRLVKLKVAEEIGGIEAAWNPGVMMNITVGGGSYVEVHTDQGLVGIGPAVNPQFMADANEYLVGKDPFDVEQHAHALRYYIPELSYQGVAGIDMALWDIIGKASNQPLYKVFGGGDDRVIPYASMIQLSTPEERADMASMLVEQGWQAIKLRLHHESFHEDIRVVETVRDAIGDKLTILVDGNQAQSSGEWQPGVQWDIQRALDTALALEDLDVYWLEEPILRNHFREISDLNSNVNIRIAGGENNTLMSDFVTMVENNVYDVLQPESMVLGGITNLRKIGTLAEFYGKKIVPHHGGGSLGVIAHMHLVASWPHAPFMELLHDPPIGDYRHKFAMMSNAPQIEPDGTMALPQGPGLGVDIDKDLIEG